MKCINNIKCKRGRNLLVPNVFQKCIKIQGIYVTDERFYLYDMINKITAQFIAIYVLISSASMKL